MAPGLPGNLVAVVAVQQRCQFPPSRSRGSPCAREDDLSDADSRAISYVVPGVGADRHHVVVQQHDDRRFLGREVEHVRRVPGDGSIVAQHAADAHAAEPVVHGKANGGLVPDSGGR